MLSTLSGLLLPFIAKVIMGSGEGRATIGALGGSLGANSANPAVGGAERPSATFISDQTAPLETHHANYFIPAALRWYSGLEGAAKGQMVPVGAC